MTHHRYIDDGIMRGSPDDLRLVGGECTACDLVSFPRADGCSRCGSQDVVERELARRGTVWTWTTQGFLPKRPYTGQETTEDFTPWTIAYVELADGVRVESRVLVDQPESLHMGQEVELVSAPHRVEDDGTQVLMFAFRPTTEVAA